MEEELTAQEKSEICEDFSTWCFGETIGSVSEEKFYEYLEYGYSGSEDKKDAIVEWILG